MTRAVFIISAARYYIGKLEKSGNSGFYDPAFEKELVSVGWYKGGAWCAFFVALIWRKAYKADARLLDIVTRMCSGSALITINNFTKNGTFKVTQLPIPGSIVIWRHGNSTRGHAGILASVVDANTMRVIEGNTNASGSREGDRVAEKIRTIKRPFQANGLNLVGFINPIEI